MSDPAGENADATSRRDEDASGGGTVPRADADGVGASAEPELGGSAANSRAGQIRTDPGAATGRGGGADPGGATVADDGTAPSAATGSNSGASDEPQHQDVTSADDASRRGNDTSGGDTSGGDTSGGDTSGEVRVRGGMGAAVPAGGGQGVVIVTGLGDTRWTWRPVEAALAGRGPVVVADRPRHDELPTLAGEVARLRDVVTEHGLERPLLVAHSFGALIAEGYARRWPVAGLVLVDPSWAPDATRRGAGAAGVTRMLFRGAVAGGRLLDATGLARRLGPVVWRVSLRAMALRPPSAGVAAAATSVYRRGETLAAAAAEELAFRDVAAAVVASRTSGSVVEVPVVVLTAVGVSAETSYSRHWIAAHRRLAALFPLGRHEIVRGAGHMVHVDRPEVIVRQVHRCLSGRKCTGLSTGPVDNSRLWKIEFGHILETHSSGQWRVSGSGRITVRFR